MMRIKIVVNLAPADLRKEGSAYDLPIAVGVLAASRQDPSRSALDQIPPHGRAVARRQPAAHHAGPCLSPYRRERMASRACCLPRQNAREAAIVS
jgi:magnesium chelatase family protein